MYKSSVSSLFKGVRYILNAGMSQDRAIFNLVPKLRSDGQSRALILNISQTLGNPFYAHK